MENKIKEYAINWLKDFGDLESDVEEEILSYAFREISLDSLDVMDLLIEIEEEFDIDIGMSDELDADSTVQELLEHIKGKL